MEIVSKLLGHSKLQTTQDHYGQILQKRVAEQMDKIRGEMMDFPYESDFKNSC